MSAAAELNRLERLAGSRRQEMIAWQCKVGINGFGRIGRLVFRALVEQGLLGKDDRRRRRQRHRARRQPRLPAEVRLDAGPVQRARSLSKKSGADEAEDDVLVVDGHEIKCLAVKRRPGRAAVEGARRRVRDRIAPACSPRPRRPRATSPPARRRSSSPPRPRARTSPSSWASTTRSTTPASTHIISQRELHHQLPRAGRARAAEGRLRHRRRADDDGPQLHRDAEDGRRPVEEGLEGRPGGGDQHHPVDDRAPRRPSAW